MLTIVVPETEIYNEETNEFSMLKPVVLKLEHSLVSISKWETKWHKPFLSNENKTFEETLDYIRCMTISQNVDVSVYRRMTSENLDQVNAYLDDKATATWFSEGEGANKTRGRGEVITSELIYYWMVAFNIPFECQKWPLQRLLTLIRICTIKNAPDKKMSKTTILSKNRDLNEARRKAMRTKG